MKGQTGSPRQVVDRFLGRMGEPISEEQSERATSEVLERLRAGDVDEFRVLTVSGAQVRSASSRLWIAIAAGVVAMVAGGLLQMTLVRFADADVVARASRGDLQIGSARTTAFPLSSHIAAGDVVKAGFNGGAIALLDGSQIDLGPRTELSVIRVADGLRVRLTSGTVLVSAAKQHNGHLYVETKDCLVSVVGTVFAVNAEETGSRVSVLEGEVHVQRGDVSQTVLAGQEVSTSPQLGPLSTETGNALVVPERLAVLQPQPTPAVPQNPASPGVTVRGVVKQGNGAGIPDATVILCPASATRVTIAPPTGDQPQANDVGGRIIRNKTFFFALWDTARCNSTSVTTDSSGRFQFSNVAAGEYTVSVDREGYFGPAANPPGGVGDGRGGIFRYFNGWVAKGEFRPGRLPGDSKTFAVDAQQAPQEISLSLTKAGVITGRVRDAEGRLVVNSEIRVMPVTAQEMGGLPVATATTNDLGEYRAYWILPGEYRVVAAPPAGRPLSETWFPRGATAAEGVAVTVREGEEVPSIDIGLRPGEPNAPVQPAPGEIRWRLRTF